MWFRPSWLSVETYGLILVFFSAIFYALAGAFVKLGHLYGGLPSTELVFARGIFQGSLVVLGLYICRDAKGQRLIAHPFGKSAEAQKLVWMRGIIGGAGFLLDYHCMSVLPLGDAMTLMSLYPFITIVLARIFLQEEIKALHLFTTIASVLGAVFIGQPTFLFGGGAGDAPTLGYAGIMLLGFHFDLDTAGRENRSSYLPTTPFMGTVWGSLQCRHWTVRRRLEMAIERIGLGICPRRMHNRCRMPLHAQLCRSTGTRRFGFRGEG
jgi:drug/metabolite transporter (DMT)-like permease